MCPALGPGHSMGPGNEKEDPEKEDPEKEDSEKEDPEKEDSNSKNDPKENKDDNESDPNKKKNKFPGPDIKINQGKIYFQNLKRFITFQITCRYED